MGDDFNSIRALLVPYAVHYHLSDNTDELYSLDEELPHSRTQFAFVHPSKGGARLGFYPLHVFPELAAALPATLASKVKSKSLLAFRGITTAELRQLSAMFAAGHRRIKAQRALAPKRSYCTKIDLEDTTALITKLATRPDVTVTPRKTEVVIALPPKAKVPRVLAARQTKPGTLAFKTITPAEHEALVPLLMLS